MAKLNLTEKKNKCHRTFCYKRCLKWSSSTSFSLFTGKVSQARIGHSTPCVKRWPQCLILASRGIVPFTCKSISFYTCCHRHGHIDPFAPFFWLTHSKYLCKIQEIATTLAWDRLLSEMNIFSAHAWHLGKMFTCGHVNTWAHGLSNTIWSRTDFTGNLLLMPLAPAGPSIAIYILPIREDHLPVFLFKLKRNLQVLLLCFVSFSGLSKQ
jgi:hypothetical protein